jgi:hypothetical protein
MENKLIIVFVVAALGAGSLFGIFKQMKDGFGPYNLKVYGLTLVTILTVILALSDIPTDKTTMKRPKHILIYDNGGTTADRYTVVYTREPYDQHGIRKSCLGMSAEPFAPHGICMHGGATIGPHLGKRITWDKLPADCQRAVIQDLTPQ